MLDCYLAVIGALLFGLVSGARIGLRAGALELRDRLASGELMRRIDIGADRPAS